MTNWIGALPWVLLILVALCVVGCFASMILANVYRRWKGNRFGSAAWIWAGLAVFLFVVCFCFNVVNDANGEYLTEAAGDGKRAQVQSLIADGADVNHVGEEEETPLASAISHKHKDVIVYLLAHGANPNLQGMDIDGNVSTPLHAARNHPDLVQLLRAAGAKP